MKKLMIMGGGPNQIPLIKAGEEQYDVYMCDGNNNAIGKKLLQNDKFFNVDVSNPDIVYDLCCANGIDGVVCNIESLMYCASIVQTRLGSIGNTPESIITISEKSKFRKVQNEAGVFCPKSFIIDSYNDIQRCYMNFYRSVIIKPDESSGSRGVKVFDRVNDIDQESFNFCLHCSRNKKVIVEEYVPYDNDRAFEAEAFVINGKLEYLFLYRTIRDNKKKLVPQCYCSNTGLSNVIVEKIQNRLQRIFMTAGIQWGEYNVELVLTNYDDIFFIEINARQGGMMLPEFVHIFSGVNLNRLLISTAVGDYDYKNRLGIQKKNVIHFRLLADKTGIFQGVTVSNHLKSRLVWKYMYYQIGDEVIPGANGYASIGILDFLFENDEEEKVMETEIFSNIDICLS